MIDPLSPLTPFIVDLAKHLHGVEDVIRYYQTMDNMLKFSPDERRVLVRLLWEERDNVHKQLVNSLGPSLTRFRDEQHAKAQAAEAFETERLVRAESMHRESIRRDVIKELVASGWTGPVPKKRVTRRKK